MWTSDRLAEVEGATKVTVHERKKRRVVWFENISHTQPPETHDKGSKGPKIITQYVQAFKLTLSNNV